MFGPFYRVNDSAETIRRIRETGELWGKPPAGIFQSDFPKVKAYAGHLPDGIIGFEFETEVAPDEGSVPSKPTWSNGRPGVVVQGEHAKIKARIIRQNV
jgi:hypothetical protein